MKKTKSDALRKFDLSPENPVITILGGSQGSKTINHWVSISLDWLVNTLKTQVIWQTGKTHFDALKHFESIYPTVRLFPFLEDIGSAYSAADLIISRAGALTLAEITWCGKPSLLIPFSGSAADHQTRNADSLKQGGAAVVLTENELSTERFNREVEKMISTPETLLKMSQAAKLLSLSNSTERLVDQILTLVEA